MHSSIWYIGSKVTTWVAPSPCAASHASFSSSVHVFSFIGIHGWTVAMCSHLPLSAISVSSGEALRLPRPSPEAGDGSPSVHLRVDGAWAPMDAATAVQLRCRNWAGRPAGPAAPVPGDGPLPGSPARLPG